MSFDVVVFPFVPVTAIINALVYLEANSTSDIIFFFLSEGLDLIRDLKSIPGLIIISFESLIKFSVCPYSSYITSNFDKSFFVSDLIFFESDRKMSKPFFCANFTAPIPLTPEPRITVLLLSIILILTLLELVLQVKLRQSKIWKQFLFHLILFFENGGEWDSLKKSFFQFHIFSLYI